MAERAMDSHPDGLDQPDPLRVTVVVGSTRQGRLGPVVATWIWKRLQARPDVEELYFDLACVEPPDPGFAGAVDQADAVIVVTPEYNHSFPGPLKTAIDSLREEWRAKPVGFVSYGGISGGLRAVEALRVVFAELHAVTVRETVSVAHPWEKITSDGALDESPEMADAADRLLEQLRWWAEAVRARHNDMPYVG